MKNTKIQSSCDAPNCGASFDLTQRGLLKIRAEWRRAKSLGWRAERYPIGRRVDVTHPDADRLRLSAGRWLAFCPEHSKR